MRKQKGSLSSSTFPVSWLHTIKKWPSDQSSGLGTICKLRHTPPIFSMLTGIRGSSIEVAGEHDYFQL